MFSLVFPFQRSSISNRAEDEIQTIELESVKEFYKYLAFVRFFSARELETEEEIRQGLKPRNYGPFHHTRQPRSSVGAVRPRAIVVVVGCC
jgi:hypothetical protein